MLYSEYMKKKEKEKKKKEGNISSSLSSLPYNQYKAAQRVGLDTLESDLNTIGSTVFDAYNRWQTAETMHNTKASAQKLYDRIGAYEEYRTKYGNDTLPDLSELHSTYKTALEGWDDRTSLYGQYKNAEAFDKAVKNYQLSGKFKGLSYDDVQARMRKYAPGSDEYNYLKLYTEYTSAEDFEKALKGTDAEYDLWKKSEGYKRDISYLENNKKTFKGRSRDMSSGGFDAKIKDKKNEYSAWVEGLGYSSADEFHNAMSENNSYRNSLEKAKNVYGLENPLYNYADVIQSEDFQENSKYNSTKAEGFWDKSFSQYNLGYNDLTYEYINNQVPGIRDEIISQHAIYSKDKLVYSPNYREKGYDEILPEEVAVYNALYDYDNKNGTNKADKFLEELEVALGYRLDKKSKANIEAKIAEGGAGTSTFLSALTVPVNIAASFYGATEKVANGLTGKKSNPYSFYNSALYDSAYIRDSVSSKIAEATEGWELLGQNIPAFLYNTGMSMLDSAAGGATLGAGHTVLMGYNSYQQTVKDLTEQGYDAATVQGLALVSGALEAAFEYAGFEHLIKLRDADSIGKMLYNALASQGAVEGLEEFSTSLGTIIAEIGFLGEDSQYIKMYKDLLERGFSSGEASSKVATALASELGWSYIGGHLSGTGLGAGVSYRQYTGNVAAGKDIRSAEQIGNVFDIASISPEVSQAYETYTRYANKDINADNATNAQIGNLYNTLSSEAREGFATANKDLTKAKAIIEKQKAIRERSPYESQVNRATARLEKAIANQTDAQVRRLNNAETLEKLGKVEDRVYESNVKKAIEKREAEVKAKHEAEVKKLSSGVETSVIAETGKAFEIKGVKDRDTLITNEGEVAFKDVELSEKDARLFSYARGMASDEASLYYEQYDGEADVEQYTNDFNLVTAYANHGFSNDYILQNKGVLSTEQVNAIYSSTRIKADKEKTAAIKTATEKQAGILSYQAKVDNSIFDFDGTNAEGKVNWKNLDTMQRRSVAIAEVLSKGVGFDLVMEANKRYNGKFDMNNRTMYLDVFARKRVNEEEYVRALIPTLAHELTHPMEKLTPGLWRELNEIVFKTLYEHDGIDEEERIKTEMKAHSGRTLTELEARAEIICRACEDVLKYSKEGKKIFESLSAEEQKTFAGKIKELLKNLLEWVEELLGLYESTSYEAKIMKRYQAELSKLVETWDKALIEMRGINKATKGAVEDRMNTKNSQNDGEIKGTEDYTVDTRYASKGRFRSEYNWHTGLTNAQVTKVEEWVDRAGKPESKQITDTAFWYNGRLNGNDLFVIYSTEDEKATVLYLTKGKKANTDLNILLDLLEENKNGDKKRTHPNGKPVFTQRVSEGNWVQNVNGCQHNIQCLGSGQNNQNAGVLQGQSPSKPSRAFENVIRNLFEIQERKSTSIEERLNGNSIRYSDKDGGVRSSDKITAETSDTDRMKILSKKSITAPIYEGQADSAIKANASDLNSKKIGLVKAAIVSIGEQFGIIGENIRIEDVDVEITLSKSNLKESVSKKATPAELAKLFPILNESVKNAIGIERHDNRYYFDTDTVFFENLIGGYADGEYFVPVRFGLKHSKNGKATLYVVVDQNKIPLKSLEQKNKTEVINTTAPLHNETATSAPRSVKYSLSQIIPFVKSKDVLRYIPDDMLDDERRIAKWKAIAETIIATADKNDKKYNEYISDGKIYEAQQMVEASARANGYTVSGYHGTGSDFTIFDESKVGGRNVWGKGFYFGISKGIADDYASWRESKGGKYRIVSAFLKMDNPYIPHKSSLGTAEEILDRWFPDMWQTSRELGIGYIKGKLENSPLDLLQFIAEHNKIEIKDVLSEYRYDSIKDGGELVVFNSNQIKSAETITYDDDGNIIPLSQRFNAEKDDIRYSDKDDSSAYDLMGEKKRLLKENEVLKADVERLKERLKIEKQVTHGKRNNESQLIAAARVLKNKVGSEYSLKKLVLQLDELYSYIGQAKELTWEDVFGRSYYIAKAILNEARPKVETDDRCKTILKEIRKKRISLSDKQKVEAEYVLGKTWRNKFFNRVIIANDGIPLDIQWQEWAEIYPEWFDADTNSNDQIVELLNILNSIRNASETIVEYYDEEMTRWLATEVYNQFWTISQFKSTADKYDRKIKELNFEHRNAINELRNDYKKRLEDQKFADEMYYGRKMSEAKKVNEEKLNAQRKADREQFENRLAEKAEEAKWQREEQKLADDMYYGRLVNNIKRRNKEELDRAKALGAEKLSTYKENAARKTKIQRITSNALSLNDMLLKNSKDKHVPKAMKGAVVELLRAIDFSSKRLLKDGEPTKKDISLSKALGHLKDAIIDGSQEIGDVLDEMYGSGIDELTKDLVESVEKHMDLIGDQVFTLNEMSLDELKKLDKIVKIVQQTVNRVNKFHIAQYNAGVQALGVRSTEEIDSRKKVFNDNNKHFEKLKTHTYWNNLNPVYAFKNLGEASQKIFTAIQDGQDKLAFLSKEVIDFAESVYSAKDYDKWKDTYFDFAIPQLNGEIANFSMNVPQIMSLYCVSKQEDARTHILHGDENGNGGGITIVETDKKEAVLTNIRLTEVDLNSIVAKLDGVKNIKGNKTAKAVADELQKFMYRRGAELGNEISMARWGIKSFGITNYFPIKVSEGSAPMKKDAPGVNSTSMLELLNMSFTHARNHFAKQSVEIGDVFDVFANHMSNMVRYNAMALPILDMYKWLNCRGVDEYGAEYSVQTSIKNTFGDEAWKYFSVFLKDVSGGTKKSTRDKFLVKFFKNAKIAKVAANLRVALLQFASYVRAGAVMDNKYLLKAIMYKPKSSKAKENCGIALWKSLGYFDTDITRGLSDQIKHVSGAKDKIVEWSLKGAEKADEITWGYLWNACELEIRDTREDLEVGSKEFNNAIALRLRDVIYRTQVVDSMLTRSQMMRSPDGWDKVLTTFASENTLSLNLAMDVFTSFELDKRSIGKEKAKEKNKKHIKKTITAYIVTNIVTSALQSLFDAFRDYDEDEKDEEYWLKLMLANFLSNSSVLGKTPFGNIVMSVLQGFTPARMDVDWLNNATKTGREVYKLFTGEGNSEKTVRNALKTLSDSTGIAAYNVYRDVYALYKLFADD